MVWGLFYIDLDTLFFITTAALTRNLNGGTGWGQAEQSQAVSHYLNLNNARIGNKLTVHSISIVRDKLGDWWIPQLSAGTGGTYKWIPNWIPEGF